MSSTELPSAASLQERLRAHADLLGIYTDTEAVVADLRDAADKLDRVENEAPDYIKRLVRDA